MNTAIYSPSGSSAGIGFAVPVDTINDIVPSLLDGSSAQRHLGLYPFVRAVRLPGKTGFAVGVPVVGLEPGAGAEVAGIRAFQFDRNNNVLAWGDIIAAIDGKAVRSPTDLSRLLRGRKRGEQVKVTLVRGEPEQAQVVEVSVALK
jgi:S1-C subfamily serine protease